jgi:DNA-binding XRE family transcriptional regulator
MQYTGRQLREIRFRAGIRQREVADKLSVSHDTVRKWETAYRDKLLPPKYSARILQLETCTSSSLVRGVTHGAITHGLAIVAQGEHRTGHDPAAVDAGLKAMMTLCAAFRRATEGDRLLKTLAEDCTKWLTVVAERLFAKIDQKTISEIETLPEAEAISRFIGFFVDRVEKDLDLGFRQHLLLLSAYDGVRRFVDSLTGVETTPTEEDFRSISRVLEKFAPKNEKKPEVAKKKKVTMSKRRIQAH